MVYLSTYIYRYVVLHVLLSSCIMYSTYIVIILIEHIPVQWKEKKQISWTQKIKIMHLKLFLIKEGTSVGPHIICVSILNYSLSFLVTFSLKKQHSIALISLQKHNFVQSLENFNKNANQHSISKYNSWKLSMFIHI